MLAVIHRAVHSWWINIYLRRLELFQWISRPRSALTVVAGQGEKQQNRRHAFEYTARITPACNHEDGKASATSSCDQLSPMTLTKGCAIFQPGACM